jgi:adenylate kinase
MISDALANEIVLGAVENGGAHGGFILDGYPRSVEQATALDGFLEARDLSLDAAVCLQVDPEVLVQRLSGRLTCAACGRSYHVTSAPPVASGRCDVCGTGLERRADDDPDKIVTRFAIYAEQVAPLLDYYRRNGRLIPVDASPAVDVVFATIRERLERPGSVGSLALV